MEEDGFFKLNCDAYLSSPHHFISNGGCDEPSDVSKSKTLVSNVVEMTVNMLFSVKHAKNRPFGAKLISTIGDDILARQSKSLISVLAASTTTTELSLVDKNTSGCCDAVLVRGNTAIAAYE